jgi:hypothetical protein
MEGSFGVVEEKSSELPPVEAVVLGRFLDQESEGVVLVQADKYKKYKDEYEGVKDVTEAGHLAKAAKASVLKEYGDFYAFRGPAVVYDYNPTDKPLGDLVVDTEFTLALREDRRVLASDTRLHGYQDPETREPVNTFFVVVKIAPWRQAPAETKMEESGE